MKEHDPLTPATRKLIDDFRAALRQPGAVAAAEQAEREAIYADAESGKLTAAELMGRIADFRQRRLAGDLAELAAIERIPEINAAVREDCLAAEARAEKARDAREAELAELAKASKLSPAQLVALVANDEKFSATLAAIEGARELRQRGIGGADIVRRADDLRQSIHNQLDRLFL